MQLVRIFDLHEGHVLGEALTYDNNGNIALVNKYELITYNRARKIQKCYDSEYLVKVLTNKEVYLALSKNKALIGTFLDDVGGEIGDSGNLPMCIPYFESLKRHLTLDSTLFNLVVSLINKHDYTFRHSVNVGYYSLLVGIRLGLPREALLELLLGGILHDVGKLKIPGSILDKPAKLNDFETAEIHKHPTYGINVITRLNLNITKDVRCIIAQHHESLNGEGYPLHLKGDEINKFAQIVAVTDKYDAIHSARAYHEGKPIDKTIDILGHMVEANEINEEYFNILSDIVLWD